ncbi:hypothetical protein HpCK38_18790 [Helicobacter pylori]
MNVYDSRDLVQSFFGKSDIKSLNPFSLKSKRNLKFYPNIKPFGAQSFFNF